MGLQWAPSVQVTWWTNKKMAAWAGICAHAARQQEDNWMIVTHINKQWEFLVCLFFQGISNQIFLKKITASIKSIFRWPMWLPLFFPVRILNDISVNIGLSFSVVQTSSDVWMHVHYPDFCDKAFTHPLLWNSFFRDWAYKGRLFLHLSHSGIFPWCLRCCPMSHMDPLKFL